MIGTIVLSLPILMAAVTGVATTVNMALFAFVFGAAIAGTIPTVRDAMLPVTDGARYVAVAILLVAAAIAGASLLDVRAFVLAGAVLVIGALSAAIGAAAFRGDPLVAAIGGGSRDPAVAAALAITSGLAGAGSVPFAYAVLIGLAVAFGKLVVRRQS
ncbi:MAG TPA: hypothetical protein VGR46_13365 [Candidatus Limnocylindria bacterium]|nr:hypothetical protein [Candidatus Limnocylindria bacterium]